MHRRSFLATFAESILAAPLAVYAQQKETLHRIGFLSAGTPLSPEEKALRQGLRDHGYVEGRNLLRA